MSAKMRPDSQSDLLARAERVLPAGGFGNFDPSIVIREGRGGRVWDENGREYVDFLLGSGPMLVGHSHPEVVDAVQSQLGKGFTFFASNADGIALAEEICDAVACAEQLRYVSTGSEADMYAMRLARAPHGARQDPEVRGRLSTEHVQRGLDEPGARAAGELPPADSPIPPAFPKPVRDNVLVAPFNDAEVARQILAEYADEIAGVIVEPLQRLIPPAPGFLETLREETEKHGMVLIFDEVVTGFRLAYGGAQAHYGVTPDLCTLGKTIGGGFPLAALAGRKEVMAHFDKAKVGEAGFTFQVGTLSGNPIAAVAGLKTLEILRRPGSYEQIRATGKTIMGALTESLTKAGLAHQVVGDPVLFDVVFTEKSVA